MAVIFQIVVGNYPVPDYQQMWTEWVMIKLDLVEIQESLLRSILGRRTGILPVRFITGRMPS
ncbi:hypothetical protein [Limnofasciculus baicalensis]|uniref:Uncharacterized protein n=1 Tax=Limnofasciculus baicalensis BBK-W-15 TaxID=2699891 RepID=A0AAE3GM88_9CYAN|nr:hypothetical protein [Limnofasciculus baicalensis]MCP2727195.1 hypothetical protein [Limnofasciculus baicalensis BBK-W-15]